MAYKNAKQTNSNNAGAKSADANPFTRANRAPDSRVKQLAELPYDAFRRIYTAPTKEDRVIRVANICFWLAMTAAAILMFAIGDYYPY